MKNITQTIFLIFFTFNLSAQGDEISAVSEDSCNCLLEINIGLKREQRYEEIKTCISSSILNYQIMNSLLPNIEKGTDSKFEEMVITEGVDSISITSKNIIVLDKDYKKIEEYLLDNCDTMRALMTNNSDINENSVSDKKKAIEYYNQGLGYFDNKDYENAIKLYKKSVRKDKNFAFAWDMLGFSYRKNKEYKKAIECYEKSLTIDPSGRMPLMNIPIAYMLLENYKEAINGYIEFIKVFPEDPEGYYGIGRVYHIEGDYENALETTMKAYIMYGEINSPYARDAEDNISLFYSELKESNQLDLFKKIAEKYNIKITD